MIEKHEFKGEHDGLSLLVLAAVHGDPGPQPSRHASLSQDH